MGKTGSIYRKSVVITGSSSGAQTNYPVKINVHYGSGSDSGADVYLNTKCETDFDDIRFTDSSGDVLLTHWRESKTDSDVAVFWVKVPSLPASPSTATIYIYYGESGAVTESDIYNTGLFGTDFEISSINEIPDTNAAAKLTLPVPSGYPTQEYVHPSVIDFGAGGWGGYRYWMANTPYADTNDDYENPCILVSADNSSWSPPTGLTNPVVPPPSNTSNYNSDTELVYNDSTNELWMYYVISNSTMKAVKSSDGVAWTNLDGGSITTGESGTTVLSGSNRTSPSVIKLGASSWVMYTANSDGTGPWVDIIKYTSTDGRNWSGATTCVLSDPLAGAGVWHLDVIYSSDLGKYILITSDSHRSATGRGGAFWLGESTDGVNFTVFPMPVMVRKTTGWDSKLLYRPSIQYDASTDTLHVWYSAQDTSSDWWTGYTSFDYSDTITTLSVGNIGGLVDCNGHISTSIKTLDTGTVKNGTKSLKHSVRSTAFTAANIHDAGWPHFIRYTKPRGSARVSAWIHDAGGTSSPERLVLRLNGWAATAYVGIGIMPATSSTKYCTLNTSGSFTATSIDRSIGWHKFTIEYDKTAGSNAAKLYVDDVLAGTLALASAINGDVYGYQIVSVQTTSSEKITYIDDTILMPFVYNQPSISNYGNEEFPPRKPALMIGT